MTFAEFAAQDKIKANRLQAIRDSVDAGLGIPTNVHVDDLSFAVKYKDSVDRANAFLATVRP